MPERDGTGPGNDAGVEIREEAQLVQGEVRVDATPRPPAVFEPGEVIGEQFEVVRLVGRGGMGLVYEVRDRLSDRRLALKCAHPRHVENPHALRRFVEEVNLARKLRHPNIVAVYDVGQHEGIPYFTMEYLEGNSLWKVMKERGPMALDEALGYLLPLCEALEYAHKYMVHRDLSPGNVIVLPDGKVKLLDFGLARAADRATLTATGVALGKAHYMAPEQRQDAAHVDARADIYALGVMLFEMLTGQLPLGYQRLADLRPDLPSGLDAVVAHCLAPRDQRMASAGEVGTVLERAGAPPTERIQYRDLPPFSKESGSDPPVEEEILVHTGGPPWKWLKIGFVALCIGAGIGLAVLLYTAGTRPSPGTSGRAEQPAVFSTLPVSSSDATRSPAPSLPSEVSGPTVPPAPVKEITPLVALAGHLAPVSSVAFSPDGKYLVTGSADGTAKLWDVVTGSELWTYTRYGAMVRVPQTVDGEASVRQGGMVRAVAFSPDGKTVALGTEDKSATLVNVATGIFILSFEGDHGGRMRVRDSITPRELPPPRQSHTDTVTSVAFSPDGSQILTGSDDGTVILRKLADGAVLRIFSEERPVRGIAFSPDGKGVFIGYRNRLAVMRDAVTGAEVRRLAYSGFENVAVLSPDGTKVLTTDEHSDAKLWDLDTGSVIRVYGEHEGTGGYTVSSLAFSPDGRSVLTGSSDGTVKLWEAEKASELCTFAGHKKPVVAVAFSPDGKLIAAGGYDGTRLWRAAAAD